MVQRPTPARYFAWLAIFAGGVVLVDLFTSGFSMTVGPLRVSSRQAFRPMAIAVLSGAIAAWWSDRGRTQTRDADRTRQVCTWLAAAVAVLTVALGLRLGDFVAAGSDAYGYVSQASLWAAGRLVLPEPLARLAPSLGQSLAPLGYTLAANGAGLVPIYSPGLPLLMALALKIAGPAAVYLVVPLLGGLTVWLTYRLGIRVEGPRTGLAAAVLMAISPIFLAQLTQPMSDVPVTAWWLAALVLSAGESSWMAAGAGAAAAAAVLTRPNLVPLALIVAGVAMIRGPRLRRGLLFAAGLAPGVLAVAAINRALYGSPFVSGYGTVGTIFDWSRLGANLRRYPLWLLELNSPFISVALFAPMIGDAPGDGSRPERRMLVRLLLAFCGSVLLCYLFFVPFETWRFLRYLLPAIPPLLVLSSAVTFRFVGTLARPRRTAAAAALLGLIACWYLEKGDELEVLARPAFENSSITVGRYVDRTLPPNAVAITMIESGSLRLYGHRSTVRWDELPGGDVDRAIEVLRANGYAPYILLEDWEEPAFRERFAASNGFGRIDWPPAMEYGDGQPYIRIWAPDDRARFRAGLPIVTDKVPKRPRTPL